MVSFHWDLGELIKAAICEAFEELEEDQHLARVQRLGLSARAGLPLLAERPAHEIK